jgi:hypothetical protein
MPYPGCLGSSRFIRHPARVPPVATFSSKAIPKRSSSSRYFGLDGARVTHEHIEPALLRQPRRTDPALLRTEYHQGVHRSLRVTMDSTASMMPTIQKRETILLSWMPFFWKW